MMLRQKLKAALQCSSIARRLFFALLLASTLVWTAVYVAGMVSMHWPESGGFDSELRNFSSALLKVIDSDSDKENLPIALAGAVRFVDGYENGTRAGIPGFNIWRRDGVWVAGSQNTLRKPLGQLGREGFFNAFAAGKAYRVLGAKTVDGEFFVEVMETRQDRRAAYNDVMLSPESLLFPLFAGFPLLLLPAILAVRSGLRPLRDLSLELSTRNPDDLAPVKVPHEYAELVPVTREINSTLSRLDQLLKRERDFLADAAHEIRTPLAVISVQSDSLLRARDTGEREEAARQLRSGTERASRLVNQLLSLVRLDADADWVAGEVDLADIARDLLATHVPEAKGKHITLAYAGPDSLVVSCPRHALESILNNLIGNAVRYGRQNGQVEVRVDRAGNMRLRLSVCDDGPGIDPDERAGMFERFRRGKQGMGESGAGLGLAIVASAARQLNATVEIKDNEPGLGVCFCLVWDAACYKTD